MKLGRRPTSSFYDVRIVVFKCYECGYYSNNLSLIIHWKIDDPLSLTLKVPSVGHDRKKI